MSFGLGRLGSLGLGATGSGGSAPPWLTSNPAVAIGTYGSNLVAYSAGQSVPVSSLLSVSRAQTVLSYAENADGTLTSFAADTLRWGVGTGIVIENARTNLLLHSRDLSNAAWNHAQASGTISVTANAGVAPDGTNTASLVSINRADTTGLATLAQVFTGTAAAHSGAVRVKAATSADIGKTITIGFHNNVAFVGFVTVILTEYWQRALTPNVTLTASASCQFFIGYLTSANGDLAGVGAVSFYASFAQVEAGVSSSSDIPTTSATATRNADVVTATGALLTAYQSAAVTQFSRIANAKETVLGYRAGASFNGGASPAFRYSSTSVGVFDGATIPADTTIGNSVSFTDRNGPVQIVASYDGTGTSLVANGGTETTTALVMPSPTTVYISGDGAGGSSLMGYLQRLMVWTSRLTAPARLALSKTFNVTSVTISGQATQYLVPTEAQSGTFVMCHHGAGGTETYWSDSANAPTREALLAQGHILSASNAAGDNWGNQAGLDAYVSQWADANSRYSVSKLVFYAGSMGGMTSLLGIASGSFPVRGWYGVYPACNLANVYAGSFTAAINTAYNIPGGGTYAAQTAGHDPVLKSGALFTLKMRFTASAGDVTVDKTANAVQMQTLVSGYAAESYLLNTIGVHGDASNIIPNDVVAFFARC